MLPDPAPLSPAPESPEAQLLRFSLPEPPASLDARMRVLLDAGPAQTAAEAAAAVEAELRRFTLPSPPAALDARIRELIAAGPAEEALGRFVLPAPSAALDARIHALLAGREEVAPEAPAVLASHPRQSFWRRSAPFAAAAGLAACAALAMLLRPQAPQTAIPPAKGLAGTAEVAVNTDAQPVEMISGVSNAANPSPVRAPATTYAVPVGYEYQGSHTVYTRETPLGTVMPASGEPMRAVRRDKLERHLYCNPKTQETLEVDTPREDLVLENLTSY